MKTEVAENRRRRKYSNHELLLRILWSVGKYAMKISPRPFFAWRRFVLRCFGAKIGAHVNIYSNSEIYMPWNLEIEDWSAVGENALIYNLGPVSIGKRATISYRAHICAGTHDFRDPATPLLKPRVTISDDAWIGTDAFIGPGVTVGQGSIVGARAVVVKDVPDSWVVAGNPARQVGVREQPIGGG